MSKHKIVQEVGASLGLPFQTKEGTMYGMKEGFPTQVLMRTKGSNTFLTAIIRHDDKSMDALKGESLSKAPEVVEAGIKKKTVEVADGMLMLNFVKGITGLPKVEEVANKVEALIRALKGVSAAPGLTCRICSGTSVDQPLLLNGVVDRVCPSCIERLQAEARQMESSYEALEMNIPLAVGVSVVLGILGAAAWAAVMVVTNRMFWILAIGIGVLIGKGASKAAGRVGWQIQVVSGVFTVLSVLLGLVLYAGFIIREHLLKQGLAFDWVAFLEKTPTILISMGTDTLFSLGGGLIGAYYASRYTKKPKLEISVEK
jgi:hypothetical protein